MTFQNFYLPLTSHESRVDPSGPLLKYLLGGNECVGLSFKNLSHLFQIRFEFHHTLIPLLRLLLEGFKHHLLHLNGYSFSHFFYSQWIRMEYRMDNRTRIVTFKGEMTSEQLIQHHTQGEDITLFIYLGTNRLLGRHIVERAHNLILLS